VAGGAPSEGAADPQHAGERRTDDGSEVSPGGLKRAVTGRLLLVFILGDVLGAGIYALVGVIAGEVGGAIWLPLLVALGLALLTACSYAELVTRFPRAGGAAVFAEHAFGVPLVSFLVGFSMLAAGVVSAAALALAFAGDYLQALVEAPQVPVALAFLLVVALLNARGIKESLRANVVMTLVEVSGLVLVVVLGAIALGAGTGDLGRVVELKEGVSPFAGVLAASVLAFYSFVGFETSANLAEEAANPRRDYPRALFLGLAIAGLLYCLVGAAVSIAVPVETIEESSGPLLEVVNASDVGVPSWLFSLVALIAVANGTLLTMIMASRLTYGMARDGLLPPVLARVLPGRRTPGVAIVVTTLLAAALVVTGDLGTLANTVVLLLLVVFVSVNLSVLVLRRKGGGNPDHFRTPLVLPVLGILSCVVLATQQDAGVYVRAALMLVLGAALFLLARLVTGRTQRPAERVR